MNAAAIGTWEGSTRSLNNGDMSGLKTTLIGAGHTVGPDSAITAGNLAGLNVYWIGEADSAPTAGEIGTLATWVNGGGTLLVLFDSVCSGCTGGNAILSGLGTGMSASGNAVVAPFVGGNFATTGGPYNLVGQTLSTSPGTGITGGTQLAGSFLSYASVGLGSVFAFGDRSDHNTFGNTPDTVNGQLFLNIVGGAAPPPPTVPEPASATLTLTGLVALGFFVRRKSAADRK
jgi:hypothetical protein